MKALVTGATGFIGSHLLEELVNKGYDVRCLVRRTNNIAHLRRVGVELAYGDVTERASLTKASEGVDIVYHLAGVGMREFSAFSHKAYKELYQINVCGTENLLHAFLQSGIRKFVYFSSVAAMGVVENIPADESTPCNPVTPYGKTKYESERIALKFWKEKGLPVTIIRPVTVYGPGDRESGVLGMCKMMQKHIFPVIGGGNNRTALTYVDNVVQGAVLAGEGNKSAGETYIIADECPYTMNELIRATATILDLRVSIIHTPVRVAKIGATFIEAMGKIFKFETTFTRRRVESLAADRTYSILKAKEKLGYKPVVNLDQGLRQAIDWWQRTGCLK